MKPSALLVSSLMLAAACGKDPSEQSFDSKALMSHIEVLSSNAFEGRAPASPGEDKTVEYITSVFREAGLRPAFGASYIQEVPATGYKVKGDSTWLTLKSTTGSRTLSYGTDIMVWPADDTPALDLAGLELVYVGYGIVAPEENWDDYKGLDVRGKVLVFKNSDPYSDPARFNGNARLYYGRYDYKYEMAARLGAIGALIVHTTPTAGYPWSVVANSWEKEQFRLLEGAAMAGSSRFFGWVSMEAAEYLFRNAGLDLGAQLESAENPAFTPVPLTGIRVNGQLRSRFRSLVMKNTGAVLPGLDETLRDEHVVLTAHHDHLGIGTPVRGDSIFNGALDNATGVAAMLELARAAGKTGGFARSVLFMSVTGEEKGLLGAKFAVSHPPVPHHQMAVNINIDGLNVSGRTRDLVSIGLGKTSLDSLIEAAAARQKRYVRPDPRPELGYFYRSDHFAFAKAGVPVVYLNSGRDFIDKPADYYDTVVNQFLSERYHTVFDEVHPQWDVAGALEDLTLMYHLIYRTADGSVTPAWTPGDEFEKTRVASLRAAGKLNP